MAVRIYLIKADDITRLRNPQRAEEFRAFARDRFDTRPHKPKATWLNQLGPILGPQHLPSPQRPDDPTHADVEALLAGQPAPPDRQRARRVLLEAWLAHRAVTVQDHTDLTAAQPLVTDIAGLPLRQLHPAQRISGHDTHTIAVFLDTKDSQPAPVTGTGC
ncbi:MAG: hypothetical protein ACRCWS_07990 [Propionibacteriaceae bacterium]